MGEHAKHSPEDASACPVCAEIALEPTSYASILAFSKEERDGIVLTAEEAIDSTTDT